MTERKMQRQEGVNRGDFELALAVLSKESSLTAREVSRRLRAGGNERFTSKATNQVLYRLLTADLAIRDGTGEKPKWSINNSWFDAESIAPLSIKPMNPRPLRSHNSFDRDFLVSETIVKVIFSGIQMAIPGVSGQAFRLNPDTRSGVFGHPVGRRLCE